MTEHFRELQHAGTLLELGHPAEAEERVLSVLAGDPDHVVALFTRRRASWPPLHNPELRQLYGKSLRGGLLLYGPPGCGKTYLAKAVAGELGAAFIHVSLADVLDMYVGQSERNVKELFEVARTSAPCVLFLDELDAIGQKRSLTRNSGARTTVTRGTSTRRCGVPAGSTAPCWSSRRTATPARRSCAPTCASGPWSGSTPAGWRRPPRVSAAPTWPTCASRPPRTH